MSKKRRLKIEKIKADSSLSEREKEALIKQLALESNGNDSESANKRVKRSQMGDFRDRKTFLTGERNQNFD